MPKDNDKLQAELNAIAAGDIEHLTRTALSELPEIPAASWPALREDLQQGRYEIREMAVYSGDFEIFASSGEKRGFEAMRLLALWLPIAGLVLAFVYSVWALLLIPLALVPLQIAKRLYRRVLAACALSSEATFAFLFSRNLIFLNRPGTQPIYRDNRDKE